MITTDETAREKDRLPRGWGRFGKGIDGLVEVSEPDESLLSSCVGLNPTFKHKSITLVGGLRELTQTMNVVLGLTERRIIVLGTGAGGAPRDHVSISFDGLEVVEVAKKDLTLRWPEGEMHVRGIAKQMLPGFAEALRAQIADP